MARPSSSGRPGPSPCQNGILPGWPGAGVTMTRSKVMSSMRQVDAPSRNVSPDAALVDHLLVELADPRAVGQEHAEQAAVGDRAAVRDRQPLRAGPAPDDAVDAVPHDAGPQLGELLGRVAAGEQVEHRREHLVGELAEVGARRRTMRGELVDRPLVERAHGDDLLGEHVERVARVAGVLDERPRACAARPRPPRRGRPRCFGKSLPSLGSPTWWPARPMRCSPRATAPGDSTWMTRSTAPMSMPSSSETGGDQALEPAAT